MESLGITILSIKNCKNKGERRIMSDYEIIQLAQNSTAPWNSLDACNRKHKNPRGLGGEYILDSKDLITQCFNCKKPECNNCHHYGHSEKRAIRNQEAKETFLLYYCTGFNKEQICKIMKISATTYNRYLHIYILDK